MLLRHTKSLNVHPAKLHGVVLDVGPGVGTRLFRFKDTAINISSIYAIGLNKLLHKSLAEKAEEVRLGETYNILTL